MQAFVDLVETVMGSFRRLMLFLVLGGIAVAGIITLGVATTAPVVAEEIGERAERFGDRAMERAIEERRAAEFAQDGWGYDASDSYAGAMDDPNGESVGGWSAE